MHLRVLVLFGQFDDIGLYVMTVFSDLHSSDETRC